MDKKVPEAVQDKLPTVTVSYSGGELKVPANEVSELKSKLTLAVDAWKKSV